MNYSTFTVELRSYSNSSVIISRINYETENTFSCSWVIDLLDTTSNKLLGVSQEELFQYWNRASPKPSCFLMFWPHQKNDWIFDIVGIRMYWNLKTYQLRLGESNKSIIFAKRVPENEIFHVIQKLRTYFERFSLSGWLPFYKEKYMSLILKD